MLSVGCRFFQRAKPTTGKEPIARVFDQFLYRSDLIDIVTDSNSKSDSIERVNYYVDTWIRRNLFLNAAKENFPEGEKNIEEQVKAYRETLLMFSYEQDLLEKSKDTLVGLKAVKAYYQQYQDNFKLKDHQIKARFVILKKESPQLETIRKWFKGNTPQDNEELKNYCFQYATNFSLSPQWYSYGEFIQEIPLPVNEPAAFLRSHTFYETSDETNVYLVRIAQFGLEGEVAPLDYKKEDISKIIINKRKLSHIKAVKDKLYKTAFNNGDFELFQ